MRKFILAAAAAATFAAAPAFAQDAAPGEPAAPDGSKAFGFVPYVGVMGGYETFDNERNGAGIPRTLNTDGTVRHNYHLAGGLVEGVAGVNIPLSAFFIGAEGSVAKGFTGNIDWEYGVAGRAGIRAGDSGLFYAKAGYKWINFDHFASTTAGNTDHDYHGWEFGGGAEFGPKDIGLKGLTNNAGFRIRTEIDTFGNFHSLRPMLGVITHF